MLIEELQRLQVGEECEYLEIISDIEFKVELLLREFEVNLKRLRNNR